MLVRERIVAALVEVRDLKTHFPILKGVLMRPAGAVRAVDGVNLAVERGRWVGLVGESGCGKTTLGKTILRLIPPTSGHIYFGVPPEIVDEMTSLEQSTDGRSHLKALRREHDLASYSGNRLKSLRRRMQLVHQDPFTSLNPRMKVRDIIAEPLTVHGMMRGKRATERVAEILRQVGLAEQHMGRYPHQFSGGQRQRIAIARALATNPDFVVLDEPTSSLDVSVQAQILDLLEKLRHEQNLTYLYVTHNLTVAESVCDTIVVMYLGKIVEIGQPLEIFHSPRHPYTQALVLSTPIPDPTTKRARLILPGEVPSPANPPSGCRFHPRCSRASESCKMMEPPLESGGGSRLFACWHPLE
jgi:oligopeptide/dipeptide ABC transporter ATP-binding protein